MVERVLGGVNKTFEVSSATLPGTALSYTSIAQAARDNALAKVYAGWDFRKSVLDGEEMGREIAAYVVSHAFQPLD